MCTYAYLERRRYALDFHLLLLDPLYEPLHCVDDGGAAADADDVAAAHVAVDGGARGQALGGLNGA